MGASLLIFVEKSCVPSFHLPSVQQSTWFLEFLLCPYSHKDYEDPHYVIFSIYLSTYVSENQSLRTVGKLQERFNCRLLMIILYVRRHLAAGGWLSTFFASSKKLVKRTTTNLHILRFILKKGIYQTREMIQTAGFKCSIVFKQMVKEDNYPRHDDGSGEPRVNWLLPCDSTRIHVVRPALFLQP